MPFMYILECSDGSYYTGSTWNLDERISQHLTGTGGKYTSLHQPVKLVIQKNMTGWTRPTPVKNKSRVGAGKRRKL
jgi:predicted GIY-YIG superfamily endonuclease